MAKCSSILYLSASILALAAAGSSTPIILVHGFMGWGRDEMAGFKYWGGLADFQKELTALGHDVRTATVGPVSSNWDRACELFAYIKGGQVDYGAAHSTKYGHKRLGRTFPGLYPEWGTLDGEAKARAVDMLGHSMGGNTARMLLGLLSEGSAAERASGIEADSLFSGGRASWVRSITTVATPHDGTTLFDLWPGGVTGVVADLVKGVASAQGLFGNELVFDFKLDQWGLERKTGEGFIAYEQRVLNSSIWAYTEKDLSSWDLTVAGCAEQNGWNPALPGVYYMSHAVCGTKEALIGNRQVPDLTMWFYLQPFALMMGGSKSEDQKLWPSDGVVNTWSENGPKLNSTDEIIVYDDSKPLQPGKWNFVATHNGFDHLEIIGNGVQDAYSVYKSIAATLSKL